MAYRAMMRPASPVKSAMPAPQQPAAPVQRRAASTDHPAAAAVPLGSAGGQPLPLALRRGIEAMSGLGMGDVRVHRSSPRPAALGAHAFAQGRDIHLAPGKERHLPHEAWHVVQQQQGRVRADSVTRDGTPLNQSAALEREADTMGARAGGSPGPSVCAGASHKALPNTATPGHVAPVQRVVARTHTDKMWDNPFLFQKANNWIALVDRFEPEILAVKDDIADYTDGTPEDLKRHRKALRRIEAALDKAIEDGNDLMETITSADDVRAEFLNSDDDLREVYTRVLDLMADFQSWFLPAGGGFSASARSTDIDNVLISKKTSSQGHAFFRDIKIGALNLDHYKVTKPKTAPDPGNIILRFGSTYYDQTDKKPKYSHSIFDGPIDSNQKKAKKFYPKKRETTQDGAMGGVSARTYAWMSNTPGWDTQKWEWLHLRAASLGGGTTSSNLVLGTRDANTHMMPFESNLAVLGNELSGTRNFKGITVKWSFTGQDPKWKYKVDKITMKWTVHMENDDSLGGEAAFYPLEAKAVLSRTETQFIESLLKAERKVLYDTATFVPNKKKKLTK